MTLNDWLYLPVLGVLLAIAGLIVVQNHHIHKLGVQMGVVSTTVSAIQTDLAEAEGEFTATIDKLLQSESATKLDAEDLEALESLKTQAARLKNIVPNAVTIPLPDPENTVELNPTANDVLDPATVTPVDAVEPAPAPADEAAASDSADETPNGDTNTSNS